MRKLSKWSVNPQLNKKGYVIPAWLQEALQEIKSQNKEKVTSGSR